MFEKIDTDSDGIITVSDLQKYMRSRYTKLSKLNAEMIIHEFDSDLDRALNFDEFCQFSLPATNHYMREEALMRDRYPSKEGITFEVEEIVGCLIEGELRLVKKREFLKTELLKKEDFIKNKAFQELG